MPTAYFLLTQLIWIDQIIDKGKPNQEDANSFAPLKTKI